MLRAGPAHVLDSAIAAGELLAQCPACAAVLLREGRPKALAGAAVAELAAAAGAGGDEEPEEGVSRATTPWQHF